MATDRQAVLVRLEDTDLMPASEADDVRGHSVVDRVGQEIGDVEDLVIDPEERRVRFLEVGTGGFLGIGQDKQLIPVDAVEKVEDGVVHVNRDRTEVAEAPAYDPSLIQEPSYYEDIYSHYGYSPFWVPGYIYPPFPYNR
ncbi:PRC-barrel domain-containing protein [Phytoactinopolyspora halotolerans]|uniref:PRC-barrel domain containing protein n=1 Tax=Phytoactinopolyspora halotolerans TaxID=1981512 RepID=A0A6L9S8X5_9ACTN|nr:PRC-barrel domain-containing protein [Phytoactinopolyspora halotolerans]NEE01473.1 PRC-barrel domain containing protein [Phytoactinopolyspora halotolerans]